MNESEAKPAVSAAGINTSSNSATATTASPQVKELTSDASSTASSTTPHTDTAATQKLTPAAPANGRRDRNPALRVIGSAQTLLEEQTLRKALEPGHTTADVQKAQALLEANGANTGSKNHKAFINGDNEMDGVLGKKTIDAAEKVLHKHAPSM